MGEYFVVPVPASATTSPSDNSGRTTAASAMVIEFETLHRSFRRYRTKPVKEKKGLAPLHSATNPNYFLTVFLAGFLATAFFVAHFFVPQAMMIASVVPRRARE